MINRIIKNVAFVVATLIFVLAVQIVYQDWHKPFTSISSFAALEYCGLYAYTIYDHIKCLK